MYSTIVHPTDMTESCIPALQTAHDLAKTLGAKLIVCFIGHPPLVATGTILIDPKTNGKRDLVAELQAHQAIDVSVDFEFRVVIAEHSTSVKSLVGLLEEMGCDLLVMGMHKRSGMAGWFTSSITEEVVRRASCAVMVVKSHGSDAEQEHTASKETGTEESEQA